jgi:hypothetical protein
MTPLQPVLEWNKQGTQKKAAVKHDGRDKFQWMGEA